MISSFKGDLRSENKKMIHQLACCVLLSPCVPSIKLSRSHLLCCWLTSQLFFGVQINLKKRVFFVSMFFTISCHFMRYSVRRSTSMFNYCALILFPSVCNTGPSVTGVGGLWYGTVHSATCTRTAIKA